MRALLAEAQKLADDIMHSRVKPFAYLPKGGVGPEKEGEGYSLWRGAVCGARAVLALIERAARENELQDEELEQADATLKALGFKPCTDDDVPF